MIDRAMASPEGRSPRRTRRRPGAAPGVTACSKTFTMSGLTEAPGRTSTGLDAEPGSMSPTPLVVSGLSDPCALRLGIFVSSCQCPPPQAAMLGRYGMRGLGMAAELAVDRRGVQR